MLVVLPLLACSAPPIDVPEYEYGSGSGYGASPPSSASSGTSPNAEDCEPPVHLASGARFEELQEAVDAATDGEEITVCPGSYHGVTFDRPVTLTSRDGRDTTLLVASYWRVVTIAADDVVIRGFRIVGGNTQDEGGAVRIEAGLTATLDDCTIEGTELYYGAAGAGIWVGPDATLALTDSTVSNNWADGPGGGLYLSAGATADLTGTTVSGNYAHLGGGIYLGAGAELTGGTIEANTAGRYGGGLYAEEGGTVTGTILRDNSAGIYGGETGGGGVAAGGGLLRLIDVIVTDNVAESDETYDGSGVAGGGLLVTGSAEVLLLGSSAVTGNRAAGGGGAQLAGTASRLVSTGANWGQGAGDNTPEDVKVDDLAFGPYGVGADFTCEYGSCAP